MDRSSLGYLRTPLQRLNEAPVVLWLGLRISTICAASLAFLYEQGRPALRPMARLFSGPWYSYDAVYYVRIVSLGYEPGDATANFHPLYPLLAMPLALVTHAPLISLMIVSSVAGLILSFAAYNLARLDYDHKTAWNSTALLLCWPASLAIFAPYTEALFLMLAVCCLWAARRGRFWLAGLCGGLASLTRQHGILLMLPLIWEMWEFSGRDHRVLIRSWRTMLAVALVPAGYAAWIVYRATVVNDVSLDFSSPRRFILSLMISPSSYRLLEDHQFTPLAPVKTVSLLLEGNVHPSTWGDLTLGAVFLTMLIFGWKHLRASYRVYSLAVFLIAFSFYTGSLNPYISLPRHLLPAFPVFMGVASRYQFKRLPVLLIALAAVQMLVLCSYVWGTWVL